MHIGQLSTKELDNEYLFYWLVMLATCVHIDEKAAVEEVHKTFLVSLAILGIKYDNSVNIAKYGLPYMVLHESLKKHFTLTHNECRQKLKENLKFREFVKLKIKLGNLY